MDIIDKEDKSQKVEIKKTKNKVIKNKIYPIRINENKLSNQNYFKVNGIDVFFPCVPYLYTSSKNYSVAQPLIPLC